MRKIEQRIAEAGGGSADADWPSDSRQHSARAVWRPEPSVVLRTT